MFLIQCFISIYYFILQKIIDSIIDTEHRINITNNEQALYKTKSF